MKSAPAVDIVIVTYNQYPYTERCLASLLDDGYENQRIILVDNASKQESYEAFWLKHHEQSNVVFLRSEENLGFGGGCNLGLREARDGYILFLNNDTEVQAGWLKVLVTYMEKHPGVGAVQPKIMALQNRRFFEYAGAAGGFMDVFGYPFTRGRIFFTVEEDTGQYDTPIELVWCSGTAMMTSKKVLDKIGEFDPIFFMYGEEADLCWRIHHAGYELHFVPESVVYHKGMATMSLQKSWRKIYYLHRNGLILLVKNYSVWELVKFLPTRVLLDGVTFFYYLVAYMPNSWGIIRAYGGFLRLLPEVVRARRRDLKRAQRTKQTKRYPLYRRSIVVDYFLLKRKKYSQLPIFKETQ